MEQLFARIAQLICFKLSIPEIHDRVIADCGNDEALFFLAYQAASRLIVPLEVPVTLDPFGEADTLPGRT